MKGREGERGGRKRGIGQRKEKKWGRGKERNEGGRERRKGQSRGGKGSLGDEGRGVEQVWRSCVMWWGILSECHCGSRPGSRAPILHFVTNDSPLPQQ